MRDYMDRLVTSPTWVPQLHVNRPLKIRRRNDNENVKKQLGLGRDGTLYGTYESRSCTFPLGRTVSRKAGK